MAAWSDDALFTQTYNAHEGAEVAMVEALDVFLATQPTEALMCLADPQWRWETRGWASLAIIDRADEILTERLDALVA